MNDPIMPTIAGDVWTLHQQCEALKEQNAKLRKAAARARVLVELLTVRQVIQAGDAAIDAAGYNPWCINEGRATGDERLSAWWLHFPEPADGSAAETED